MKLSKRLHTLYKVINAQTSPYGAIWDCCCDHGLLGKALLMSSVVRDNQVVIHFIDVVPRIMAQLDTQLTQYSEQQDIALARWETHCGDVATLDLTHATGRQLVIIAGVGGDLTAELVSAIIQRNPRVEIDFLLCPVHRTVALRKQLIALKLSLNTECIIQENKRFYEMILVSSHAKSECPIHPIGAMMWDVSSRRICTDTETRDVAALYLQHSLTHYKKVKAGFLLKQDDARAKQVQAIIDQYESVIIT